MSGGPIDVITCTEAIGDYQWKNSQINKMVRTCLQYQTESVNHSQYENPYTKLGLGRC